MCAIAAMAILGSSISSCDSASNSKKSDKKVVTTDSIDACPPINTSETEITSSKDTVKAIGVDLGLSVLWADRNVGASSPEDYGKHYAWGAYFDFYAETPECIPHIGYWHRYNGCTIRPVCHK